VAQLYINISLGRYYSTNLMKTKVNYLDNIFTKLEGGGGSEMLCRNCFV